ncbi:hypothetical protein VNO80_16432 [Phaseolus coccineus]|uniref:Uncharacterized protein n=1 Tax=Phaseolus coccineus TaxID=3886 RepID=A0AAN9MM43_PHACN
MFTQSSPIPYTRTRKPLTYHNFPKSRVSFLSNTIGLGFSLRGSLFEPSRPEVRFVPCNCGILASPLLYSQKFVFYFPC